MVRRFWWASLSLLLCPCSSTRGISWVCYETSSYLIDISFACWQIGIVGTYIQTYVGTRWGHFVSHRIINLPRAYIPVNINHQSARTSSFILSVFGNPHHLPWPLTSPGATFYQIMVAPLQPSLEYYVSVCLSFGLVLTLALMVSLPHIFLVWLWMIVFWCDPSEELDPCSWDFPPLRFVSFAPCCIIWISRDDLVNAPSCLWILSVWYLISPSLFLHLCCSSNSDWCDVSNNFEWRWCSLPLSPSPLSSIHLFYSEWFIELSSNSSFYPRNIYCRGLLLHFIDSRHS